MFWFPRGDLREDLVGLSGRTEPSPGKGELIFSALAAGGREAPDALREASDPFLAGLVTLDWDAMDEWFVEDEQLFGHPEGPLQPHRRAEDRQRATCGSCSTARCSRTRAAR